MEIVLIMKCEYCDHSYTTHIIIDDVKVCLLCVIKWAKKFGDYIPRQQLLFLSEQNKEKS